MIDISAELITYLKTKSAVTAIVGSGTSARIYPDQIKEISGVYPCIVIKVTGGGPDIGIGGKTGIASAVIETWSFAETSASRNTLDKTIYASIAQGNATWGTTYTTECFPGPAGRDSGADYATDGSDQCVYWARTVYTVWYSTDD